MKNMTDIHVVETKDTTPIVEKTEKPWKKVLVFAVVALIILTALFLWKSEKIIPQNTPKTDQIVSSTPIQESIFPTQIDPHNPSTYSCPQTEYIDCMPGPGSLRTQCATEYLQWATENCPGFQGAAY